MKHVRTFLGPLVALIALNGCDYSKQQEDPDYKTEVAEIYFKFVQFRQEMPVIINGTVVSGLNTEYHDTISHDTVRVRSGIPFNVTTEPFGGIDDKTGLNTINTKERSVQIKVFNERYYGGVSRAALTRFPRTDRVVFSTPGLAEVVIEGVERNRETAVMEPREMRFPVKVLP